MGNVRKFPELNDLRKAEVGYILTSIAEYEGRLDLVKEEFESLFEKKISIETLHQLQSKYGDFLEKTTKKYRSEILLNPLASRKTRLRLLWWACKQTRKRLLRRSIKVGEKEWELCYDPDVKLFVEIVMAADKMMNDAEKLAIEKAKISGNTLTTDDSDIHMEDGLEEGDALSG